MTQTVNEGITLEVRGTPAPQGSKRPVRLGKGDNSRIGMVESSAKVKPWRDAVRAEASRAFIAPHTGPVSVILLFLLARPKSLPRRVTHPVNRPDLDKLVRSTLDGLKEGGAFKDDSLVISITTSKAYAMNGQSPGCTIRVSPVLDILESD